MYSILLHLINAVARIFHQCCVGIITSHLHNCILYSDVCAALNMQAKEEKVKHKATVENIFRPSETKPCSINWEALVKQTCTGLHICALLRVRGVLSKLSSKSKTWGNKGVKRKKFTRENLSIKQRIESKRVMDYTSMAFTGSIICYRLHLQFQ